MKFFVGIFFLLTVSQGVRAQVVDLPRDCFSQRKFPCQIRSSAGFLAFELGSQKYHLGPKSSMEIQSIDQISLLQGDLWVKDSMDLSFKISPALKMVLNGEWLLRKAPEARTQVFNLAGESKFISKFVFPSESVPTGFENWYGLMDSNGEVSRGVIRPIQITGFLKTWIPLSGLSMAEIRKATSVYRSQWGDSLEKSANLYREIVERRLASQEDRVRRSQEKRRQDESEKAQLRRMYRERNGLAGDHSL